MRGDHLAPEIQPGDTLQVRQQDHAGEGDLAVVLAAAGEATVRPYCAADRREVLGVVTWIYRRLG